MKKIISLLLVGIMVVSMIPTAFATTNYTNGTQVSYNAEDPNGDGVLDNKEAYTVTVPAKLAPGGSGDVVASGTWNSARKLVVTADPDVTLTNSISGADEKVLTVTFPGIELPGSNTAAVSDTKVVSVADIEAALFGTWEGVFEYNVEMVDVATIPAGYSECEHFTLYTATTLDNRMAKISMNQNSHYGESVYVVAKGVGYLVEEYHAGDINPDVAGTVNNGQCYGNPYLYNFYSGTDKGLELTDSGVPFFWMHFDGQGYLIAAEGYTTDDFVFYALED